MVLDTWYSAKRAGVRQAYPNKAMAHMWLVHDAHLGCAFLFLDILAEYTLLSMTVMVAPCLSGMGDSQRIDSRESIRANHS